MAVVAVAEEFEALLSGIADLSPLVLRLVTANPAATVRAGSRRAPAGP